MWRTITKKNPEKYIKRRDIYRNIYIMYRPIYRVICRENNGNRGRYREIQ